MSLTVSGFEFTRGRWAWSADVPLIAWRPIISAARPPTAHVAIVFDSPTDLADPTRAQVNAISFLVTHQADLFRTVVDTLRGYYDRIRPQHHAFLKRLPANLRIDADRAMPDSPAEAAFCALLDLETIFVQTTERDDLSYLGFAMHSTWEIEHGTGVVTHGPRVVDLAYGTDVMHWTGPEQDPTKLPRAPLSRSA